MRLSASARVFARMLCAVNILEIQWDKRVNANSAHLLQSWPKYKCWKSLVLFELNGMHDL